MMQRYQLKPPAYGAIQFNGLESAEEISEMLGALEFSVSKIEGARYQLQIPALMPGTTITNGDYVVRDPDGQLSVMPAREFQRKFQVLA